MKAENPQAFPCLDSNGDDGGLSMRDPGMTLRDYFAGQALAGICANPQFFGSLFQQSALAAADFARECADALLAQREEKL